MLIGTNSTISTSSRGGFSWCSEALSYLTMQTINTKLYFIYTYSEYHIFNVFMISETISAQVVISTKTIKWVSHVTAGSAWLLIRCLIMINGPTIKWFKSHPATLSTPLSSLSPSPCALVSVPFSRLDLILFLAISWNSLHHCTLLHLFPSSHLKLISHPAPQLVLSSPLCWFAMLPLLWMSLVLSSSCFPCSVSCLLFASVVSTSSSKKSPSNNLVAISKHGSALCLRQGVAWHRYRSGVCCCRDLMLSVQFSTLVYASNMWHLLYSESQVSIWKVWCDHALRPQTR